MLTQTASFVLASLRPSTYPQGYASGLHSLRPCWTVCVSILQKCSPVVPQVRLLEIFACQHSYPAAYSIPVKRRSLPDSDVSRFTFHEQRGTL